MTVQADSGLPGPSEPSPRARRLAVIAGVVVVLAAAVAVLVLRVRKHEVERSERASLERERSKGIRVSVMQVQTTPGERTVTLPGDVYGYNQTTLYAKVSGYVREVRVERGQRVKKGEILARLESPENEKDVVTARHDRAIAKINAERAERLAPSGVVSLQDRDNAVAQARVADSTLARAADVLSYTIVRAPFDGVVSARYVDPGALVPAATGATQSAVPIVDLADTDTLRIFIHVGQDVAPFVRTGDPVTIWQDELPAKRIPGAVTYASGALDPRTRTMQVEIDLDNRPWHVLPGTFTHVELRLASPPSPVVPDDAIVVRDGKTSVCLVSDGRAHYTEVDLGYNTGQAVRVLRGLSGGETIGLDVPVEVGEGDAVQVISAADTGAKAP
ncbi:MAG: efflux RND transporter periplasmic adaptor subunit [Polyangiaceae bacterium]